MVSDILCLDFVFAFIFIGGACNVIYRGAKLLSRDVLLMIAEPTASCIYGFMSLLLLLSNELELFTKLEFLCTSILPMSIPIPL